MDNEIKDILMKLLEGQNRISEKLDNTDSRLDRIEKKLDAVVEQTAALTEFRNTTNSQLEDIKDNLNDVELITASNWKDIARLKSVK